MADVLNTGTTITVAASNPKNKLGLTASLSINIFFVIYSLLCIIPLLLLVMVSFSDEASIVRGGYKFWPDHFSLAAYRFLGQDIGQILHSYGISIIVTVAGTALSMIIIALYAYPISRPNFPQAKFFTFFAFFTMLFSGGLVPWYLVYVQVLDLKGYVRCVNCPANYVRILGARHPNVLPDNDSGTGAGIGKNRRGRRAADFLPDRHAALASGTRDGRFVPNALVLE